MQGTSETARSRIGGPSSARSEGGVQWLHATPFIATVHLGQVKEGGRRTNAAMSAARTNAVGVGYILFIGTAGDIHILPAY